MNIDHDQLQIRLATASFKGLSRAMEASPEIAYVPVRTSMGNPRFKLPYKMAESLQLIAPYGCRHLGDDEPAFEVAYRARLDEQGLPAIAARLMEYAERHPNGSTFALLCFEDLSAANLRKWPTTFCHRRMFADWFQEHTGFAIPDLDQLATDIPPTTQPDNGQPNLFD